MTVDSHDFLERSLRSEVEFGGMQKVNNPRCYKRSVIAISPKQSIARNRHKMKFALPFLALWALMQDVGGRDTGLASLCYTGGVQKFVSLSECLNWVRSNGYRMLGEDSADQGMTLGEIGNAIDERNYLAEEALSWDEERAYNGRRFVLLEEWRAWFSFEYVAPNFEL